MNTKVVIEFDYINFLKSFKELVTREFCNPPGIRDVNKRIDEIISLLQQGEIDREELKKVWQMWEELYLKKVGWNNYSVTIYMQELMKKYFPKELKRGSYFYECTSEEIYHLKKIPFKEAKE